MAFFILSYVTVALQSGLTPFLRVGSSEPSLALLAMVFITINAQRQAALLGAFILGAMLDLATRQPFGLFALSYGLAALAVVWAARSVHRDHPLTHFFCALLAGAITAMTLLAHARMRHESLTASAAFAGVLYTALLAPFLIGPLQKAKRLFSFQKRAP